MVEQEIARRSAAGGVRVAPERLTLWSDDDPSTASFYRRAVRCDDDPALVALARKYPGQTIIVHRLYKPPHRHAGRPDVAGSGPGVGSIVGAGERAGESAVLADAPGADVVERASWRLAKLRNEAQ
jgi:hypothetical protein